MYEPQEGTWTLTAPDGKQWTGASGLRAAAAEQRERIPPAVQLERIFAEVEPTEDEKDAARYRWLREWRSMEGTGYPTPPWVVRCELDPWPTTKACHGVALDAAIDAVMLKTPNV